MHPAIAIALAPFAPPQSTVHDEAEEAKRLAADAEINRMKNDGTLRQRDDARALADQLKWSTDQ